MIDAEVKIHDNFSLEFKTGFITNAKNSKDINQFKINTLIFVPNSLGVNRSTYKKEDFYRDVKTNIRLITPVYSLEEILKVGRGPLPRLQKAIDELVIDPSNESKTENFVYQVKMFVCILKSALRRHVQTIRLAEDTDKVVPLVKSYLIDVKDIGLIYRRMWDELTKFDIAKPQRDYFLFGDDFMGNIVEQHTFQILALLNTREEDFTQLKAELYKLLDSEAKHKSRNGFMLLDKYDEKHNSLVITRRSILKKFVESDLFLQVIKKKDGAFAQQFYYSIAAGIAMVFATVISFFATQRYGNFTTDLFVILVFSYMFKDRIKDMMKYYFSEEFGKRYFDSKSKLSIRKQEIGWVKEAFDFIPEEKLTDEFRSIRARSPLVEAENQIYDEKIMLYRKWVKLSKKDIEKYKEYHLAGINDITRFNLLHFTQKMDNPYIPLYLYDNGVKQLDGKKMYSLFFILQCKSDDDEYFKKYRVLFNRNGISDVSEIN